VPPRYRSRTDLSSRVGWLNPAWNKPFDSITVDVSVNTRALSLPIVNLFGLQSQFQKASDLTGEEFLGRLDYYANAWLPARDIVSLGLDGRKSHHESGKIILFESFAPWKVWILDSSKEQLILTCKS
jgi:hypothetical protein